MRPGELNIALRHLDAAALCESVYHALAVEFYPEDGVVIFVLNIDEIKEDIRRIYGQVAAEELEERLKNLELPEGVFFEEEGWLLYRCDVPEESEFSRIYIWDVVWSLTTTLMKAIKA